MPLLFKARDCGGWYLQKNYQGPIRRVSLCTGDPCLVESCKPNAHRPQSPRLMQVYGQYQGLISGSSLPQSQLYAHYSTSSSVIEKLAPGPHPRSVTALPNSRVIGSSQTRNTSLSISRARRRPLRRKKRAISQP